MHQIFIENYDQMILSKEMRKMYDYTDFYNVGIWNFNTNTLSEACHKMVSLHLESINLDHVPKDILDVGCGLGSTTDVIRKRFPQAKVTGINISSRQIKYARKQYEDVNFEIMDACILDYSDSIFDLLISIEAVFHFNTRRRFLDEAYRVLKPGGQLIFSDLLLNDLKWVGHWMIPEQNLMTDLKSYYNMLNDTNFQIDTFENITDKSWMGFCSHIRKFPGMQEMANGLRQSIVAYLLISLRK